MLKKSYVSAEDIPEEHKDLYEDHEGVWTFIGVENSALVDLDLPNKFKEFRDNNKGLNKQVDALSSELGKMKAMYQNIDPEVYARVIKQSQEAAADEDKTLLAQGRVEDVVQRRVVSAITEVKDQLATKSAAYEELSAKYKNLDTEYSRKQATDHIMGILDAKGHRPRKGARQDVEDRISHDWTLNDDRRPVPRSGLTGEDGGPISDQEYVRRELLNARSWYFEEAKGGGAGGGGTTLENAGQKEVDRNDLEKKGENLEAIAKGQVRVV